MNRIDMFEPYRDFVDRRVRQESSWLVGPSAEEHVEIVEAAVDEVRELEDTIRELEDTIRELESDNHKLRSGDELATLLSDKEHWIELHDKDLKQIANLSRTCSDYEMQLIARNELVRQQAAEIATFKEKLASIAIQHVEELTTFRGPLEARIAELQRQLEDVKDDLDYWNTEHICRRR